MKGFKFSLLVLLCVSLAVSCASTPKASPETVTPQEISPVPQSEEPSNTVIPETATETLSETPAEESRLTETQEEPVLVPEEKEEIILEKLDEEDLLPHIIQKEEETTVSEEPSVFDEKPETAVSEPVHEAPAVVQESTSASIVKTPETEAPKPSQEQNAASQIQQENSVQNEVSARPQENTVTETVSEAEETVKNETDLFEAPVVINPSRSVTVKKNQYLDITYPGNGWTYIGETEKTPLFTYFGRKLSGSDTTFSLRSKISGKTVLHFYKNDPLTNQYIDDYLSVTVENENAKANTRTQAPSYAEAVPPKPEKKQYVTIASQNSAGESSAENTSTSEKNSTVSQGAKKSASTTADSSSRREPEVQAEDKNVKTVIQNTEKSSAGESQKKSPSVKSAPAEKTPAVQEEKKNAQSELPSGNLLEEAKKAYSAKEYEKALTCIQAYIDSASVKIDEALYVQGQILEAESPVKNIRSALDSYNTVVSRYPSSRFWKKANDRSIYLKRFYIDIR